jgi:GAF domain-containing protein
MRAPISENERKRLLRLQSLNILDTLPQQSYDDITYLASEIAGTPIALISIVDEERQWFKSTVGLDARETHRDYAFCAHAILTPTEQLVVRDATQDPRFADNPLVTSDPMIRFYAGSPLICSDGTALGTLCVIDRKPRTLSPMQARALQVLSRQVIAQVELFEALANVKLLNGLIPICGHCKKIRDDDGYWNQIEAYISERSAAQFSHGICPDCLKIHFPVCADRQGEKRGGDETAGQGAG